MEGAMVRRSALILSGLSVCLLMAAGPLLAAENGTAAEAKTMLERAVAAVKADKAKALLEFSKGENGFKDRDLYVFCIGADGRIDAHPNATLMGQDAKNMKDKNGKAFADEMLKVAQEGKFNQVDYMFPRPGSTEPVAKDSYVTRIGDQVCGVGYYK
jgi:signal transduction histidine kinase